MNRSYRVIFNTALNAWVAAPETARSGRKSNGSRGVWAAVAALLACGLSGAWAADISWTAGTGDWFTGGNWSTNTVPTDADRVFIGNGGTAELQMPGAAAAGLYLGSASGSGGMVIRDGGALSGSGGSDFLGFASGSSGTATVDGAGSSWSNARLFVGYAGSGTLSILNGGTVSVIQPPDVVATLGVVSIAELDGSSGEVIVNGLGSSLSSSDSLLVAARGSGTLSVLNGGTVSTADGAIGLNLGSSGVVTVNGIGSSWSNSAALSIGLSGSGTLNISNGGAVSNTFGRIGSASYGDGAVTVDASSWSNSNILFAGDRGSGKLDIRNGGTVSSLASFVGYEGTGVGVVTVDGTGSRWNTSNALYLGYSGSGTLDIRNGGAVNNRESHIGVLEGSVGALTVDGTGSSLSNSENLVVAGYGRGSLDIRNGGAVDNNEGVIGRFGGAIGTVTVEGAGSEWSNADDLRVGDAGSGALEIRNGGAVSNSIGYIGDDAGSNGTVTVDGAGSSWSNAGTLYAGYYGSGTLELSNGGAVSSTAGYVGYLGTSVGTVSVDGTGSSWTNSGSLNVGMLGNGTLAIRNGGAVGSYGGSIGGLAGSVGTVTVDGATTGLGRSSWINLGELAVGQTGSGTLDILNGGLVSSLQGFIGNSEGSSGTVSVNGVASDWINSGAITAGAAGSGALEISGGGSVSAGGITAIGEMATGTGRVDVEGTGSTLTVSHELHVGRSGNGTLSILGGGKVSNTHGRIGVAATGSGTARVEGAGSEWTNSAVLFVGEFGRGTLDIASGGAVSNTYGVIGYAPGGDGAVTVDASGWSNTGDLEVGSYGSGTLEIRSGGAVSNFNGRIGYRQGSSGTVSVSGTGSTWVSSATLAAGYYGNGVLTISDGGRVSSGSTTVIGLEATGTGRIDVEGAGSTLLVDNTFSVGRSGSGALNVREGGVVRHTNSSLASRYMAIGENSGGSGTVTVSGAGSLLSTNQNLLVGFAGNGTLNIVDGGTVSGSGFGIVGNLAGAVGAVTVDGEGARWDSAGSLLFVGDQGDGTLTLANGGTARVGQGEGILSLAGSTTGAGVLNIGAGAGAGVLDAATVRGGSGSATLNFNHSDGNHFFTRDGSAGGAAIAITGTTRLNHNGAGTTVLTGANTHTGGTHVNAGRLLINGSLAGGTFVNAGGTLGGSGTLGTLLVRNGGTLSPGNSPGILTVSGDLTLEPGSLTLMEIDGRTPGTEHDQINVSGSATLDGSLQLDFGFVPVDGDRFNLINAASIVRAGDAETGFASIDHNLGAALQAITLIDPTTFDILVRMSQGSFLEAASSGLTRNQRNVAMSLDRFSTSGQAAELIAALNTLSADRLPDAFDRLSGVQHTHAAVMYPRISRQLHDVLAARLAGIGPYRDAQVNAAFAGVRLAAAGSEGMTALSGLGNALADDRRIWLQASGGFGEIDRDRNASGADYRSAGLALGAEADVSERVTVGAALAYTRSDVDVRDGDLDIDSYQAAVYGNWQSGAVYVRGSAGVGHHETAAARRVSVGGLDEKARADYSASTVALSVEAGRTVATSEAVTWDVFGGIDYVRVSREGFTEKGADDARLKVSSERLDSLQSSLGVRAQGDLSSGKIRRTSAYVEAAWLHEFADDDARLHADFVAAPGNVFQIDGPELDRDRVRISAGINTQLTKAVDLDLSYRGDLAGSDRHHVVGATLRMRW